MPCWNDSEKMVQNLGKMKERKMEKCAKREMYMKNNGTYFDLDKWNFCTTVSVFVPLIKGKV